ncbi:hypothetical protein IMSAGC002_02994 [Lachnospiraceae bacterium]|nr:hypothetical protein IMSAGC002_02994 [Lachnospiraceae bacterium]
MFKNRAIEILKNKYGVIGAILVSLLFSFCCININYILMEMQ